MKVQTTCCLTDFTEINVSALGDHEVLAPRAKDIENTNPGVWANEERHWI